MPTSDLRFRRGDVIVVPFPYSDQLAEKRRPVLVLSGEKFNAKTGYLWVAMITSQTENLLGEDIILSGSQSGLSKPSLIRLAKIATIESHRVLRKAGQVETAILENVAANMKSILA